LHERKKFDDPYTKLIQIRAVFLLKDAKYDDDDDDVNVQDYHLPTTRYEGIDHLSIIKKRTYFIFFTRT